MRVPVRTTVWLLVLPLLVGGCAALQADPLRLERENAELRRMLVETRREMEELRRDQERLRAAVEYLQYGKAAAARSPDGIVARSAGGYETPSRSWPAGRWPGDEATGSGGPERLPYGDAGDLRTSTPPGEGPEATVATQTEGPGPLAGTAATPYMTEPQPDSAADDPGARVVMGVREGGDWSEPGNVSAPPAPTVPPQLEGTLYADGVQAMNAEQYDEAIQFFRDFIHLDSTSPAADDAQFWIAECYRRKGMESCCAMAPATAGRRRCSNWRRSFPRSATRWTHD